MAFFIIFAFAIILFLLVDEWLFLFLSVKLLMLMIITMSLVFQGVLELVETRREATVKLGTQLNELSDLTLQQNFVRHLKADSNQLGNTPHALELVEPAEAEDESNACG